MTMEARLTSDIPEKYARLYDYNTGKFETPLDNQGIADIDALFELAIHTYPDHLPRFEDTERNIHHVYWTERFWKDYAASLPYEDANVVRTFRNSTPQLAYVPVPIHAWIEEIMTPPPAPAIEVMRRRNAAWASASMLLRGAVLLDKARSNYENKKDDTRRVLGPIDGITPRSRRRDIVTEEQINREYWLSELNGRLEGWRKVATLSEAIPDADRFVVEPRLTSVRALKRRIKQGAIVPRLPERLAA